ncbi:hypothetical protein CTAYLR_004358 [Chrysophaeum taylorii]|uniref:Fe2OG dioxygenase domain-containing protein n=1 Tax=Chrysophaeum taylorii TaxID=2483200 RepID=A0AAD7ULR9_9STRA|nr:hypothetical protein CTAYLR_004358 [Chrysophaeum taylorii]
MFVFGRRRWWWVACSLAVLVAWRVSRNDKEVVKRDDVAAVPRRWPVACAETTSACGGACDRVLIDDWLGNAEIDGLIGIATRGMAMAPSSEGGPTIFDANSGYVMAPGARLANVYARGEPVFSRQELELYRGVIRRLKHRLEEAFPTDRPLVFTAPTFVARLSGQNASWEPMEPHDEYWHPHVDKQNTHHYDYSGLLYLSDYDKDFEGGLFEFFRAGTNDTALAIQPRRGRLLLFAASQENRHRVRRVTAGLRSV